MMATRFLPEENWHLASTSSTKVSKSWVSFWLRSIIGCAGDPLLTSSLKTSSDAARSLAVGKLTDSTYGLQYGILLPGWRKPTSADVYLNAWALFVTSQLDAKPTLQLPAEVPATVKSLRPTWQQAMIE